MGTEKPASGTELTNAALSEALKTEHEFTKDSWESFGVKGLTVSHFILVGEKYFQPDGERPKSGNEIVNEKLSDAIKAIRNQEGQSLSRSEIQELKIEDLKNDSFIKVDNAYFKQAASHADVVTLRESGETPFGLL